MPPMLRLLRPQQYTKNLLVFAAPGAAGSLDQPGVAAKTLLAFALFSAVSSVGYIVNDIMDLEADRAHPTKQHRPLASGEVSTKSAINLLTLIGIPALLLGIALGWRFAAALVGYATISLTYSSFFKRIPWIELLAVSAGFVVRAVAGGAATATPISTAFLVVVSAGALLIITGKRLGELLAMGQRSPSREVLARYQRRHLQVLAALAAALAVGGYGTWAAAEASNQVPDSQSSTLLRVTVVPFAVAIVRYLTLSWRGAGETPESLIVRDPVMLAAGATWAILYSIGLYL